MKKFLCLVLIVSAVMKVEARDYDYLTLPYARLPKAFISFEAFNQFVSLGGK
jgi:hypothetical protein